MARIRSVHPGLFTDEAFVSCSPLARLLYIGLWTEADDGGVFEWKPVTIKMRLMPVDNADIPALLLELAEANMVKRYSSGDREYGIVRNFCRFQRPKKPKSVHPMPSQFRTYAGSDASGSEPDDDEGGLGGEPEPPEGGAVPKKSRKSSQMEDGGEDGGDNGRGGGGGGGGAPAAARPAQSQLEVECRGMVGQEPCLLAQDFHVLVGLLDEGLTEDDIRTGVSDALRIADPNYKFRAWRNFEKWIRTAGKNRLGAKPRASSQAPSKPPNDPEDPRFEFGGGFTAPLSSIRIIVARGTWVDHWGPKLGEPGCRIPEKYWVELKELMPKREVTPA